MTVSTAPRKIEMDINVTQATEAHPLAHRFETDGVGPLAHATVDVSLRFVPYGLTDDGGPAGHDLDLVLHWAMVTTCGSDGVEPTSLEAFYTLTGFNAQTFGEMVMQSYNDLLSDMADSGD